MTTGTSPTPASTGRDLYGGGLSGLRQARSADRYLLTDMPWFDQPGF
jgi:hypothetical protein